MNKIKAVIFDLDGTLTNTLNAIAHFGNLALTTYGLPPIATEDYKYHVGDGRDKLIHRMLAVTDSDNEEMYQKVGAVYDENYEKDFLYDTDAYDGIRELIAELKTRGIKIAVCTNKPDNVAHFVVETIFGKGTFDIISGVKKGGATKPDPKAALQIADAFGLEPRECLFMGDTNVDIRTAVNADMNSVGVLWGFRDEAELKEAGAEHIIKKPSEILDILGGTQ
ncbi:MAG: HAD family hydrolase [Clostridia bacterium]|nr:HAD family hydrolase [Clostridia bacterium]